MYNNASKGIVLGEQLLPRIISNLYPMILMLRKGGTTNDVRLNLHAGKGLVPASSDWLEPFAGRNILQITNRRRLPSTSTVFL